MKHMTKRALSLLLTLSMLCSLLFGVNASATSSGQRVEAVTSLQAGEQYIITATYSGTTYALSAAQASVSSTNASAFRAATAVTISDGVVTSPTDLSNLVWEYTSSSSLVNADATSNFLRCGTGALYYGSTGTAAAFSYNGSALTAPSALSSYSVALAKTTTTKFFSCVTGSSTPALWPTGATNTGASIVVYKLVSDDVTPATYNVTFNAPNASVSGTGITGNSATVEEGGSLSFTVTADDGYQVDSVTATNGTVSGGDGSYTLSNVTADTTVTVAVSAVEDGAVYNVTFSVSNASVSGTGITGNSATVEEGGSLSFTVTADDGYQVDSVTATNGTVSGSSGSYTLSDVTADTTVTIATSAVQGGGETGGSDPWDGTSVTPSQASDGYYVISNAKELAGFAELTKNNANAINGRLTADIDLNGRTWTAIGTSSYPFKGVFDGQGHTIDNLYFSGSSACYGLFAYIDGATIKNLIVSGTISNSAVSSANTFNYGTAGIVGYAKGSFTIENCGNEVDISASCSVGGIVGAVNVSSGTQTISACYNAGELIAGNNYGIVGGICGYVYNVGTMNVTNCYNVGTVKGTGTGSYAFAAGILGCSYDSGITIQNCYHAATVTGSNYAQIATAKGNSYLPTVTNSYATGTASSSTYAVNGTQKDASQITVSLLGSAYQDNPNGTPALSWEEVSYVPTVYNVTFYTSNVTVSGTGITGNSATVEEGGSLSFTVTVNEGYTLSSVTADNGATVSGSDGSYTLSNITADTTVTVSAVSSATGGGTGTESDPYRINNEAELKQLAASVNAGTSYSGVYFLLTSDIVVTGSWTPIGTGGAAFAGSFNGYNHTVTISCSASGSYNGLFGNISGATVERVIVAGTVSGGSYTAGVAGNAENATVRFCGNEATVTGSGYVGGIVGYASGTEITACYNKGSVTNTAGTDVYTGGIVGNLRNNSSVSYSYNTGALKANDNSDNYCYTGGIVGMIATSTITKSYSTGTITATSPYTGGVLGSGNAYYLQGGHNYYLAGTAQQGIGYNTGGNGNEDSADYVLSVTAADLANGESTAVQNLGFAYKAPAAAVNGGYPSLMWETDPTYELPEITQIYSKTDLEDFAASIARGVTYEGVTVYLMNDISLGGVYNTTTNVASNAWTAIGGMTGGTIDNAFAGTFDGNNHTISDLVLVNSSSGYQGLFAILDQGGTIKNLTVSGTVDMTLSAVGSLVGWNLGTVENCVSNVSVHAPNTEFVGGLVGDNAGTVKNCVNNGTVNGGSNSSYVGGVVGHCEPAYDSSSNAITTPVVQNCVNNGNVTGGSYVGGVVGAEFNDDGACASITGSANHGDVSGTEYVGGVVGYMDASDDNYDAIALTNCYNTGDVTGTVDVGGIVGNAGLGELTIRNCFNAGQISGTATTTAVGEIAGYTKADIYDSYYVLDVDADQVSVASGSGDNYSRPVTYAYLDTDACEEMIGYAYTLPETADANETASYYADDIYTINVLTTTEAASAAQSADSVSVTGTSVTINRLENALSYSVIGFSADITAPNTTEKVTTYFYITDQEGDTYAGGLSLASVQTDIDQNNFVHQAVFTFNQNFQRVASNIQVLEAPREIAVSLAGIVDRIHTDGNGQATTTSRKIDSFTEETISSYVTTAATANSAYSYTVNQSTTDGTVTHYGIATSYVTLANLISYLSDFSVNGSAVSFSDGSTSYSCTQISFTPIDNEDNPEYTRTFNLSGSNAISLTNGILAIESFQAKSTEEYTPDQRFNKADRMNAIRLIPSTSFNTGGSGISDSVKWISEIGFTLNTTLLLGDVNGDGVINSNDVTRLQNLMRSSSSASAVEKALADINGDGSITQADYNLLSAYVNTGS